MQTLSDLFIAPGLASAQFNIHNDTHDCQERGRAGIFSEIEVEFDIEMTTEFKIR